MQCRNPTCDADPAPDSKWCPEHREMYARMRTELESERSGMRSPRVARRRRLLPLVEAEDDDE